MKKLMVLFVALGIVLSIGTYTYAHNIGVKTESTEIKGVTILSSTIIDIKNIQKHGYNTVFLEIGSIRNTKAPYNTNFKLLKILGRNIAALKTANLNFYLCFMEGPGYSRNGVISSLYKNKYEMLYFSQMAKEIINRYAAYKNFLGVSINIGNSDIPRENFYKTENYIIANIRNTYENLQISYNLHPLSYEEGFKYLPTMEFKNITLNFTLSLSGLSYPGYGAGYTTSLNLNKNAILQNLEKIKDYQSKYSKKAVLTLEIPWIKHTEILLQDLFEISKMLDLDYNIHFGNSSDIYNISKNPSALKVLDRHNQ